MTPEIRHALRRLRKKPAFSLTAIATLALGIGFNTVVFSLVNFMLLRPLPISDPENVFSLQSRGRPNFSFPNYLDIREGSEVFADLAALRVMPMHVSAGGEKWRLWGYLVTGSYFDLLGIQAWRGRLLSPSDDVTTGAHPVAVVSHASWQRRFGSDPAPRRKHSARQRISIHRRRYRPSRIRRHGACAIGRSLGFVLHGSRDSKDGTGVNGDERRTPGSWAD